MSEQALLDRQNTHSENSREIESRTQDVQGLIHDIIGNHQEFFADPQNRLDFIKGQTAEEFLNIAQYINAKIRGEKPHQLKHDESEKGGFLLDLHTPSHEDKPVAFKNGYEVIQSYLETTVESAGEKVEKVAMAIEALVIWVHPFNDGNGRTSRFMAKLVEDGAISIDQLVSETVDKENRARRYPRKSFSTREGKLVFAKAMMLDDDELDAVKERSKNLPSDVDAIGLDIKAILENEEVRQKILMIAKKA